MRLAAIAVVAAIVCGGCQRLMVAWYGPPRIPICGAAIPPNTALAGDFTRRLRVHVTSARVSEGFEVIVQHRRGELTLVGLTRFGAKAFTVVQSGDEIRVVSFLKLVESVPPVNILADILRWPLGGTFGAGDDTEVHRADDGRSAVIVNQRCGYRTTIFDLTNDGGT